MCLADFFLSTSVCEAAHEKIREGRVFFKRVSLHLYGLKQLLDILDCEQIMLKLRGTQKYASHRGSMARIFIYSFKFLKKKYFNKPFLLTFISADLKFFV